MSIFETTVGNDGRIVRFSTSTDNLVFLNERYDARQYWLNFPDSVIIAPCDESDLSDDEARGWDIEFYRESDHRKSLPDIARYLSKPLVINWGDIISSLRWQRADALPLDVAKKLVFEDRLSLDIPRRIKAKENTLITMSGIDLVEAEKFLLEDCGGFVVRESNARHPVNALHYGDIVHFDQHGDYALAALTDYFTFPS